MYDENDDPEEQTPPGAQSPALQAFRSAFTDPHAQAWANEIGIRLNDYFQRRRIATQNTAAGQNFINDIGQFQKGLVGMVRNDPIALHTALDLVHPTMAALIGTMPGDAGDRDAHHAAITADIEREIAAAGITSAAERSEPLARNLLDNDRIKSILGDGLHQSLHNYTTAQHTARMQDLAGQEVAGQAAREFVGQRSATNYLSALTDPRNGELQFPDGWNQGVMADPRLPPVGKAVVSNVYQRLSQHGDAEESDPYVAARMIGDIAQGNSPGVHETLLRAGDTLRLGDALHIANLAQATPNQKGHVDALHAAVQFGERMLAAPENGPAGEAAFSRYMNWLLPAARSGAVLDPASPDYALGGNRMQMFAPNAADAVNRILPGGSDSRPSLQDIFYRPRPSESMAPSKTLNDAETNMAVTRDIRMDSTGDKSMERKPPQNSHIMLAPEMLPGITGVTETEDRDI